MPLIFVNILNSAPAAGACRLGAVEEAPQQVRQNDKHKSVQNQTSQLGNALACGDPATCNLAGQLERLGAGDGNECGKGNDLLDGVHFIMSLRIFYWDKWCSHVNCPESPFDIRPI